MTEGEPPKLNWYRSKYSDRRKMQDKTYYFS